MAASGEPCCNTVLTRRGLTPSAVLPISLVLLTRSEEYVEALTAYRHDGSAMEASAAEALSSWMELFLESTSIAVDQAGRFAAELAELRAGWVERLASWRAERGVRERPRAGSAVARLDRVAAEAPVMTARTVQRMLGLSFPSRVPPSTSLPRPASLPRRQIERGYHRLFGDRGVRSAHARGAKLASTRWDPGNRTRFGQCRRVRNDGTIPSCPWQGCVQTRHGRYRGHTFAVAACESVVVVEVNEQSVRRLADDRSFERGQGPISRRAGCVGSR